MTDSEIRIAKRVVKEMLRISHLGLDMKMFQGVGMCLAFIYEECTGNDCRTLKPKEVMQWAIDLPTPPKRSKLTPI